MVNIKTEHKSTQSHRDSVKKHEEKMRSDPVRNKQRLDYHKEYYRKMKEALKQINLMNINTHEIIV